MSFCGTCFSGRFRHMVMKMLLLPNLVSGVLHVLAVSGKNVDGNVRLVVCYHILMICVFCCCLGKVVLLARIYCYTYWTRCLC